MIRVALVTAGYWPDRGGVERHVAALASRLHARGQHVTVLTQSAGPAHIDAIQIRRFPAAPDSVAPALLRQLNRPDHGFDVVHAHNYHNPLTAAVALTATAPVVITTHYHGTGRTRLRRTLHPIYRPIGRRMLDRAAATICVSQAERALLRQHFPDTDPVVIPNGIDEISTTTHADNRAGIMSPAASKAGLLIVAAGRLEPYKNTGEVIDAMVHLADASLLIVGDGPARSALEHRARERGVAGQVRFAGPVDDATFRAALADADVFVTLSEQEAFGLTVAEALAAGTPVLASDIAAHAELSIYAPESVTLISARADGPELAAAIRRAATGAVRLRQPLPTWEDVYDRTVAVYESALCRR